MLNDAAFANAREPLAQAFKPVGGDDSQRVPGAVNHFKSKGSGTGPDADQGDGQGASNGDRVRQARRSPRSSTRWSRTHRHAKVFLLG